jgi:ribulose-5-phosphate 4-epimerase/fuculose-1-phosphate aldolase
MDAQAVRSTAQSSARSTARAEVLAFARRMTEDRLVAFTAGNVSRRVDGQPDLIATTPRALPYDTMQLDDICLVTLDGDLVEGDREPTSELPLHTLTYRRRPDLGAIVHTHSPAAMAMAAVGLTLPPILIGLVAAAGGAVLTAPYARTGTPEMADAVEQALADRGACLLRFHGVLAIGRTLAHAYNAAAVVESSADAYLRALSFGEVPVLPDEEVDWLAAHWRSQWTTLEPPAYRGGG